MYKFNYNFKNINIIKRYKYFLFFDIYIFILYFLFIDITAKPSIIFLADTLKKLFFKVKNFHRKIERV